MTRCAVSSLGAFALALAACHGTSALDHAQLADSAPKDAITKTSESGPVKVTAALWPAKPTLDQALSLRLTIEAPSGITVKAPFQEAGDQRLGRFTITQFAQDRETTSNGGERQVQLYTLQAPSSGRHRVPPLRLEMIDGRADAPTKGKPQELLTDELPIEIAPIANAVASSDLHGAPGALDPDVGGVPWLLVLGGASALAILGAGGVLALRTMAARRRIEAQRSAYDEADARLRELEAKGAPTATDADDWFVALSAIVRAYIERRYDIRAPELTTEEFLAAAASGGGLSASHRSLLTTFLERCDRVKFAGYRPDSEESIATLAAARGFVEDTRVVDAASGAADASAEAA